MSCDTIVLELFDLSKINKCREKSISILIEELKSTKLEYSITQIGLTNNGYNNKQIKSLYKKRRYYLRRKIRKFKKQKVTDIRIMEDIITTSENKSCYYFEGEYYVNFRGELNGNILFRMSSSHNKLLHSYDETCSFLQKFENNVCAFKNLPNYDEILKFWKYHNDRLIYVE